MKALLIIDMQVGSFSPKESRFDTDGVIERINRLAAFFRYYDYPVIFIQHDGSLNDDFIPGSPEWQILPELHKSMEDSIISKHLNDCFHLSDLEEHLRKHGIHQLYITGCATDFCIDSTVRSAHTRGFEVHAVKDGHTTGDRPNLRAEAVIDHHNWIWENMIPNKKPVVVASTSNIIRQFRLIDPLFTSEH